MSDALNEWLIFFKKDINRFSDKCEIFNLETIIYIESNKFFYFNGAAAEWPIQNFNNFLIFKNTAINSNHKFNKYISIGAEI